MIALAMKDIEKYYGVTKVLYNITLEVNEGEKVALIGSNGTGKTTVFKIIAGIENYDGGMLALKKGSTVGYLEQIAESFPGLTAYEVLLQGLKEAVAVKNDMEVLEAEMSQEREEKRLSGLIEKYGKLRERFEYLDGYNMDSRIDTIAQGLAIPRDMYEKSFDLLSGGEKTKILFARMLIAQPDILLLDEPTNHLDIEAIEWLEGFIRDYKGTVLVISHDRYFLDKAISRVIEIEEGECESYNGNYSYFVTEKERRLMVEFENYQDQQKKIKQMEEAIKRLIDWGNRGDNNKFFRRAASMQKALDRMQKIKRPQLEKKNIALSFEMNERSGRDVVVCKGISKAFDDKVLFDQADFYLRFKERVGLIGANGTGKSTLIKMLLAEAAPESGEINMGANVKVGYLPQAVVFDDETRTVLEEFRDKYLSTEGEARNILAKFLFYKDSVFKRVKDLSGGEKTRLKLAQLMYNNINLLILDEPTNHLDIETREVLENALENFEGTILFISHDRYFINKLTHRLYHIQNRSLTEYCGNYDYFKEKSLRTEKGEVPKKEKKAAKVQEAKIPQSKKALDKEAEAAKVEKNIEETEAKIEAVKALLDDPQNASDYLFLQEQSEKVAQLEAELQAFYEKWQGLII